MLCSEHELGLSNNHDGIIKIPKEAPLGKEYASYIGLDDPIFDISITPNRADCLGISGIARDLSAAGLGTFTQPKFIKLDQNLLRKFAFFLCFVRHVPNRFEKTRLTQK